MNDSPELDAALLEIRLKDFEICMTHTNVRMATVSQITNFSVALAGALLAGVASVHNAAHPTIFVALPLPFLLFALLILREDNLMAHHDLYMYRLRAQILDQLRMPRGAPLLRLLPDTKDAKSIGFGAFLSFVRYLPALLFPVASVAYFFANSYHGCTSLAWLNVLLLVADIVLFVLLAVGMWKVLQLHKKVEVLANPRSTAAQKK